MSKGAAPSWKSAGQNSPADSLITAWRKPLALLFLHAVSFTRPPSSSAGAVKPRARAVKNLCCEDLTMVFGGGDPATDKLVSSEAARELYVFFRETLCDQCRYTGYPGSDIFAYALTVFQLPSEDRMMNVSVLSAVFAVVLAGCASAPSGRESASAESASARTEVCKTTNEQEIAALFDRWNRSLQTGDPRKVAANYSEGSILLPTVSDQPRLTRAEKEDYFHHFLEHKPVGKIDSRTIKIGCNTAVDAGLYTFTFGSTGAQVEARYTYTYRWDGNQWLITSHHSSAMPEKK
jgi:uncharacterized protein (TIGR02246 family)